ncbi:MAG: c-type cytochrome [Bdellovibrionales bacterium]|nr:c-type cytochrome [Bdellovibrionales bacterium]
MSDTDKDKLTDHEYDGIKELDNPLPGWWLATFYITIVFSIVYYAYYELGSGPSLDQELQTKLEKIEEKQNQAEMKQPDPGNVDYSQLLADNEALATGKDIYMQKCAACHGAQNQGVIGPNLTDNYWLNGKGTIADIAHVIVVGVPENGMPPWKGMIKDEDIPKVAAYIKSKVGSSPAGAKAPQGELIEE